MRTILGLSILALLAGNLFAANVNGTVADPSGRAIPHAFVSLFARDQVEPRRALTGDSGDFRFTAVSSGEYLLQVEAAGFATYTLQWLRVQSGDNLKLEISLTLPSRQEQVVVTAAATPQAVDEVAKSVTVVTGENIEQRDEFFIPEALRSVPGLRVQQLGGPGAFTTIKIRGLRNEDTSVLFDGLRFRDPTAPQGDAESYVEDLFVTDVDRIEVLRGSASALYGTNASGGVINIITGEGGGPARGNILVEGGGLGLIRGRAQMAGGARQDRLQYSGAVSHLNVTAGVGGHNPARNTGGQGYLSYLLTPRARISARFYGADSFVRSNMEPTAIGSLPPGIVSANPGSTFLAAPPDPDASRTARFLSGAIILSGDAAPGVGYTVSYHGLNTDATFPNGPAGSGFQPTGRADLENNGTTHTVAARISAQLPRKQLFDAGYEFEDEHFVSHSFPARPAPESNVDVAQGNHSVFAQDQVRLFGDRLQFAAAFRGQWFSLSRPLFAPAASAPYQGVAFQSPPTAYTGDFSTAYFVRSSGTKLRAHAGRGYGAPSLYERFGTFFSSFGYGIYGDPRLHANRSIGGDAGIDQTFGTRARASVTYFYTGLQEIIAFGALPRPDPFGRFSGYKNAQGGFSRGIEASLSATITRSLQLTSAYTFTNSRQRTPVIGQIMRSLTIPEHTFSFTATQHVGARLYFNFDLTATSNYLAILFDQNFGGHPFRFEGMRKADIGASYSIPAGDVISVRFFAKAENVFDQRYFEGGFRTPGVWATAGLQFGF